jgi:hypothetical protein
VKRYSTISLCFLSICNVQCQNTGITVDSVQYPVGYPKPVFTAIGQLKTFPLPRYLPGNHLQRLFNWMDPMYAGGQGQPGLPKYAVLANAVAIQKELILNWNFGIVITANGAFNGLQDVACPAFVTLANTYPDIPLDVITSWMTSRPKIIGYPSNKPMIANTKIDSVNDLTINSGGKPLTEVGFNFPDTLIRIDGAVQRFHLMRLEQFLIRPIDRISEDGEEPPAAFMESAAENSTAMFHVKDSLHIDSWDDFIATEKLRMRNAYSSMVLKGTQFSFYDVDGGPIDRFKWQIIKKCNTQINGNYYSTPDFYPRWSSNWKDWAGAWHGWKWIELGRKTEIKDGDRFFSPYIAAGWAPNPEKDIRPAQWLGLLKCLSIVGAEFYYVGYFNLHPPYNDPSEYIWQAAIPAYSQAIASRYEDVLRDGNVLFDKQGEPIISYPTDDKSVLVTIRKHNKKEKYVISGTYQPFSNNKDEIPEKKEVTITFDNHTLTFEIRRQGSTYIYENTGDGRRIFYQLDSWHENSHPDYWSKDFYFEAEVADSGLNDNIIYTQSTKTDDYSNFVSYIHFTKTTPPSLYHFTVRDSVEKPRYLFIRYQGSGTIIIIFKNKQGGINSEAVELPSTNNWKWLKVTPPVHYKFLGDNELELKPGDKCNTDIDKFVITEKGKISD